MGQYLLIFRGGGFESREGTNEDQSRLNSEWDKWRESLGQNLIYPGAATALSKTAYRGGVLDFVGDRISAFCVINANTIEEALELARKSPTITEVDGQIDVYDLFDASKTTFDETNRKPAMSYVQYTQQAQAALNNGQQLSPPDSGQTYEENNSQSTEPASSSPDDGTLEVHPEDHQQD